MGLLSHIEEADYFGKRNQTVSEKKASSFHYTDFFNKYPVERFCIFSKSRDQGKYDLKQCFGIDAESVFRFNFDLAPDFFDDFLDAENRIYEFNANDVAARKFIEKASQGFQKNCLNSDKKIAFYKSDASVFVIFSDEIMDKKGMFKDLQNLENKCASTMPSDFEKNFDGGMTENYYKYQISFADAINNCLEEIISKNESYKLQKDYVSGILFDELFSELCLCFPKPNYLEKNGIFSAKLFLNAKNPVSPKLLESLLLEKFKSFFGGNNFIFNIKIAD